MAKSSAAEGVLLGFQKLKAALDVAFVEAQRSARNSAAFPVPQSFLNRRRHCCYSKHACWQTILGGI
jgi:hypothetical protein